MTTRSDEIKRHADEVYALQCINCDHSSPHECNILTKEVHCQYFVSQYGGGGACYCNKYVPRSSLTQLQVDLIEVFRNMPRYSAAPNRICLHLGVPIPDWERSYRR